MINKTDHPVAWVLLLYEIDELREHLDSVVKQMNEDGRIDDEAFRVDIAHAYAHLNRIWNSRDEGSEKVIEERHDALSKFPTDIVPL